MFKYYNANPLGRNVNDCSVRAIACATDRSWYDVYDELSLTFACLSGINELQKVTFAQ